MILLIAFLLMTLGFLGLWIWMQKKVQVAKADIQTILQPLSETLQRLDEHQRDLERRREGAYASLSKQIEGLNLSELALQRETAHLAQALRSPQMRGSWGQVHLRRVVELAGLVNQCDFYEQKTFAVEGGFLRPDLVVRLPGERCVAVDAKVPLEAYLDAEGMSDEGLRKKRLLDHAAAIRKHIRDLSSKEYWKQLAPAPEYVILYLPAEAFFSAALQADPLLIEVGADQNILLATPTTLIAILRAVAHGWKQESFSKSAQEIARLGQELYERLGVVCEYWQKVGKELGSAVDAYNQSVTSLESRVFVTARKLKETGGLVKELPPVEGILKTVREPTVSK